jgi:glycine oxidase
VFIHSRVFFRVVSKSSKNSDVLIIGGGVIGMCIARELKKRGVEKVTLLERGKLGAEASSAAAGMLTVQADATEHDEFFDLCHQARGLYENFAAEIKDESGIDIELETSGTLSVAFGEADSARLEKIFAWQNAAGYAVEKLSAAEVLKLEPAISPAIRGGLYFPRDAQVENRLLVKALGASLRHYGVEIRENTAAESLSRENGKITGAETDTESFAAPVVVLATGAWTSLIKFESGSSLSFEVFPVRGQMLSYLPGQKLLKRVVMSADGYLVPRLDGRILAGATVENAGFEKIVTTEGIHFLLQTAEEIMPGLKSLVVSEEWAGLRPCSADSLPILGKHFGAEGLFVATAHYRNGILLAPLTGKLVAEEITAGVAKYNTEKFGVRRLVKAVSIHS